MTILKVVTVHRIDSKIGISEYPDISDENESYLGMIDITIKICEYFKITTIDDLEKKLIENEERITKFVKETRTEPTCTWALHLVFRIYVVRPQ